MAESEILCYKPSLITTQENESKFDPILAELQRDREEQARNARQDAYQQPQNITPFVNCDTVTNVN